MAPACTHPSSLCDDDDDANLRRAARHAAVTARRRVLQSAGHRPSEWGCQPPPAAAPRRRRRRRCTSASRPPRRVRSPGAGCEYSGSFAGRSHSVGVSIRARSERNSAELLAKPAGALTWLVTAATIGGKQASGPWPAAVADHSVDHRRPADCNQWSPVLVSEEQLLTPAGDSEERRARGGRMCQPPPPSLPMRSDEGSLLRAVWSLAPPAAARCPEFAAAAASTDQWVGRGYQCGVVPRCK